jgi:hypothetical protein
MIHMGTAILSEHVPVGYWWQNTRSSILLLDKYSCDFVSHPNNCFERDAANSAVPLKRSVICAAEFQQWIHIN